VRLLALAAAMVVCFSAGAAAAWLASGSASAIQGDGPRNWVTSSVAGDASASTFVRATIARTALWMLPKTEVVYFITEKDDAGQPLDVHCTYELQGQGDLPARWWSVGIYVDYHFVPNSTNRYSFSKTTVRRDSSGAYTIRASRSPQDGNWLPLGDKDGSVQLMARLYQPDAIVTSDPSSVPLPTVRKVSCE
jgi:hypothetical protein